MINGATARCKIFLVSFLNFLQIIRKFEFQEFGEHRRAVLVALAFADDDFVASQDEAVALGDWRVLIYPLRVLGADGDVVFRQRWRAFEAGFNRLHL